VIGRRIRPLFSPNSAVTAEKIHKELAVANGRTTVNFGNKPSSVGHL
jgi:hypothetical protein